MGHNKLLSRSIYSIWLFSWQGQAGTTVTGLTAFSPACNATSTPSTSYQFIMNAIWLVLLNSIRCLWQNDDKMITLANQTHVDIYCIAWLFLFKHSTLKIKSSCCVLKIVWIWWFPLMIWWLSLKSGRSQVIEWPTEVSACLNPAFVWLPDNNPTVASLWAETGLMTC